MSFSFGTPSSAPATAGLTGGFNFGANKPATPGFGLTATSQPSTGLFGSTPATSQPSTGLFGSTPATSAPAFGSGAFGSTTPAFGATSSAPSFGATTTPAFGAATSTFGTSSAAPAFGTATPAFGVSAAPAFGSTTTPAFGATSSAPAFGATTTPAFGTTSLGTAGLNFGVGSNTSATGLTFGTPAATTAATGLGGFGFGASTTTQGAGFGLGSFTTATTSSGLFGAKVGTTGVAGTQLSTTATPSFGLGGVTTATGIGSTTTAADSKNEPPKQTKLPNEINTTVESFKEFVKKQKSLSSEVMRVSIKPLQKVSRDADSTLRAVATLSGEVGRARAHSRRLRAAAAAALAAADSAGREMAEPGSELEGSAPPQYVKELIAELEQQLITFRRQMDVADKQMQAEPKLLTEQELTLGIRRMHESLVALAGRLQAVHTAVEAQKDQYLNLRKYVLKDPTDVFHNCSQSSSLDQILRDAEGNRKKMKSGGLSDFNLSSAVVSDPKTVLGNLQHLAGPTPFSYIGNPLAPFAAADASVTSWQPQPQGASATPFKAAFGSSDSGFQLQKPPGKRGKQ